MHLNVRQGCDGLFMQRQLAVFLMSNIANGPRQVEIAVNAAFEVDCATCAIDPIPLFLQCRLVVCGHGESASSLTQDASRIAGIGADESIINHEEDVGCATFAFHHLDRELVLFNLCQGRLVSMESQRPLDRRSLVRVLLRYSDHCFHAFRSHEHLVES